MSSTRTHVLARIRRLRPVLVATSGPTVGRIDNTRPMTLGGKVVCDGTKMTRDHLAGAVDWVTIERP